MFQRLNVTSILDTPYDFNVFYYDFFFPTPCFSATLKNKGASYCPLLTQIFCSNLPFSLCLLDLQTSKLHLIVLHYCKDSIFLNPSVGSLCSEKIIEENLVLLAFQTMSLVSKSLKSRKQVLRSEFLVSLSKFMLKSFFFFSC